MARVLIYQLNWLKVKIGHGLINVTVIPTEITGAEETNNTICYNVDNKYYSAVIHLCWGNVSAEEAGAVLVITDINRVRLKWY